MSLIEIKGLHKKFRENVVLDGIDLSIRKGDVIGIIGPSGTGKSTLLRCINQLELPEKGSIEINDRKIDLSRKNKTDMLELRKNTGMVFQQFNLFERKTALQNVEEGLIVVQKKTKEEARRIALQELDRVGMMAWANHYPRHMSGGQQQRVAIARALAMRPQLLLFDEPTASCIYAQKGNKNIRKPQAAVQTAFIFARLAAARLFSINAIRCLCWS